MADIFAMEILVIKIKMQLFLAMLKKNFKFLCENIILVKIEFYQKLCIIL